MIQKRVLPAVDDRRFEQGIDFVANARDAQKESHHHTS